MDRKQFAIGLAAAAAAIASGPAAADGDDAPPAAATGSLPTTPRAAHQATYFFSNSAFEFVFLTALGRAYHQAGNVGKILHLTRQVQDGDFEGAFLAFLAAGDEASALAAASLAKGHRESARQAYMWAQNYYDSATYFVDGSNDPSRFLPTWDRLDACWKSAIALMPVPGQEVWIPYENTPLRGYYFSAPGVSGKRPLLIMNNGSDGSLLDMLTLGGAGALARGYDVLTFDGPGQGYALWKQNLHFRPDWETVITPVVDHALTRGEVDPGRIALLGVSQGGYWVPRAAAFEKRIAAAVADPGVVDVSTSWTASVPEPMLGLLAAGKKEIFDGIMDKELDPATKAALGFRMRPYGLTSYFDVFRATAQYRITPEIAARISCPVLVTAPANEAFWPGQSQQLFDMLTAPKALVPFTPSDGADLHCEPQAYGLRDLRIFDWLDEVLR